LYRKGLTNKDLGLVGQFNVQKGLNEDRDKNIK